MPRRTVRTVRYPYSTRLVRYSPVRHEIYAYINIMPREVWQVEGWPTTLAYTLIVCLMVIVFFSKYENQITRTGYGINISYPRIVVAGDVFSVEVEGKVTEYEFELVDGHLCWVKSTHYQKQTTIYDIICAHNSTDKNKNHEFEHFVRFVLYGPGFIYKSDPIEVLSVPIPLTIYRSIHDTIGQVVVYGVLFLVLLPLFLMVPQEVKKLIAEWR